MPIEATNRKFKPHFSSSLSSLRGDPKALEFIEQYEIKNEKYDLIISVHSWYYIGNNPEALHKALALRTPLGKFYMTLTAQKGTFLELERLVVDENEPQYLFEDFLVTARSSKIPFQESYNYLPFNHEAFWKDERLTEKGQNWISFMSRTPFKNISGEKLKRITDFLSTLNAQKRDLVDHWGELIF